MYLDVSQKESFRGFKTWRNPKNRFNIVMLHYTADKDKDPQRDGKDWYENERRGVPKADWLKEYEIDFTTKSGKLIYGKEFCDFDPKIHLINSFELGENIEYILGLDFGQRNPTCALVGAWTRDNVLYIVDEYYKPALPSVSSREMFKHFDYLIGNTEDKSLSQKRMMADNAFQLKVIDPTTRAKNRSKVRDGEEIPYSIIEDFYDHGWEFEPGMNEVDAGITRVREYLQLDSNNKPHLYIFKDKCPYLAWEIQRYKYRELTEIQDRTRNESEEPIKKDDHSVDCLRYILMTRPQHPEQAPKPKTKIQKDIEQLLKPRIISHNFDNDSEI